MFLDMKLQGNHMLFTKGWSSSAPELSDGLSSRRKQRYQLILCEMLENYLKSKNMMINVVICILSLSFLEKFGYS